LRQGYKTDDVVLFHVPHMGTSTTGCSQSLMHDLTPKEDT